MKWEKCSIQAVLDNSWRPLSWMWKFMYSFILLNLFRQMSSNKAVPFCWQGAVLYHLLLITFVHTLSVMLFHCELLIHLHDESNKLNINFCSHSLHSSSTRIAVYFQSIFSSESQKINDKFEKKYNLYPCSLINDDSAATYRFNK